MKVLIVGLGLIGGSVAKVLSNDKNLQVVGLDCHSKTLTLALDEHSIEYAATVKDLSDADVIILAMSADPTIKFIEAHHTLFNKEALVVDVCGIKRDIMSCFKKYFFENGPAYIGMHPMAGRELFGYEHADGNLFQGASLIITKEDDVTYSNNVEKIVEYAYKMGFREIVSSTPEEHDKIIAYTSQLAHVVSSAYIKSPTMLQEAGFSAGSFRDLTRVARLDENMWTDLMMRNSDYLIEEIDEIIFHLQAYKEALALHNSEFLKDLLKDGREKKEWSNEHHIKS